MALTMIFALAGSLILALILTPVLTSLFLPRQVKEKEPWLVRQAQRVYAPVLAWALRARIVVLTGAALIVAIAAFGATRIGGEFLPKLKEGALVVNIIRLAGFSIEEATEYNTLIERLILERFPDEVERVWSRIGTTEVATDQLGIELTDVFITLKPRRDWTRARTQEDLVARLDEALEDLPGQNLAFTHAMGHFPCVSPTVPGPRVLCGGRVPVQIRAKADGERRIRRHQGRHLFSSSSAPLGAPRRCPEDAGRRRVA